jgi:hypothetical protein
VLSEVLTEFLNITPTSFCHSNVTRRDGELWERSNKMVLFRPSETACLSLTCPSLFDPALLLPYHLSSSASEI